MHLRCLSLATIWISGIVTRAMPLGQDHLFARDPARDLEYTPPPCGDAGPTLHVYGQQVQGNFTCPKCGAPEISDRTLYPVERWAAADGDAAWDDMKNYWLYVRNHPGELGAVQTFVQTVSYGWNGPSDWQTCGRLDDHCNSHVECSQVNVPAGAMVLNAFSNIRSFYKNMYQSIQDARGDMITHIGHFSKTFAPQNKKTLDLFRILLDIFGIAYGFIGAAFWNKTIQTIRALKMAADNRSWAKDSANALVAGSIIFAKDDRPGIEGQVSTADDISSMLGTIVQGWANTTDAWLDHLFSGTDQGLADLDKQILGGAWADSAMSVPNNSLQDAMERIIYGRLIPAAWTDHPDVHPVIVYSNRTNETNPTSPIGVSSGLDFFIDPKDKTLEPAKITMNNTNFWLVDAHDCKRGKHSTWSPETCFGRVLQLLPGLDALGPDSSWGRISINDIVYSSWAGWNLNGGKNGYQMPNATLFASTASDMQSVFNDGVRTPGFFPVPVCDFTTVIRNVANFRAGGPSQHPPNYPCSTDLPKLDFTKDS